MNNSLTYDEEIDNILTRVKVLSVKVFGSMKNFEQICERKQGFISAYISKKIFLPSDVLFILATRYNVNINWLLTGKGSMLVNSENVEVSESVAVEVPILTNEIALQLIEEIKSIKKFSGIKEVV